jgi:actin-related protein
MIISASTDDSKKTNEISPSAYTLPDGNTIVVKDEKILGPEILFNPSLVGLENLCNLPFIKSFP